MAQGAAAQARGQVLAGSAVPNRQVTRTDVPAPHRATTQPAPSAETVPDTPGFARSHQTGQGVPKEVSPLTEGYSHDNGKPVLGAGWHAVTRLLDVTHRAVQVLQVGCQGPLVHCRTRAGSAGWDRQGWVCSRGTGRVRSVAVGQGSVRLSTLLCTNIKQTVLLGPAGAAGAHT